MDEQKEQISEEQSVENRYVPRPRWQVWLARIGLVLFLIVLFCYYYTMFAKGGA